VDAEDLFPAPRVGVRDGDLPVESTGPKERRVEHVRPVGRREHHDARRLVEAVHLDEELVQRLVGVGRCRVVGAPALSAERVDFVDEDDAGGHAARLGEQRTHA
jgi:hypothetical protein